MACKLRWSIQCVALFHMNALTCSSLVSWIPKVEVTYTGTVNCSDVVMANGKGLILAQTRCFLCGQSAGLKIRCDDDCCSRQKNSEHQYYHVTCARQAGLEVNVSGDDDLIFYCESTLSSVRF